MPWFSLILLGILVTGCAQNIWQESSPKSFALSVVKIQAVADSGKRNMGSGVVIAPNKVATNCHVTHNAKKIFVFAPDKLHPVITQSVQAERDACILQTEQLNLPPAGLADSSEIKVGDEIVLAGFSFGLGLGRSHAKVIALRPFGDDNIIEVNTGFNHGASGGGVFDNSGKLIGLMTFMGSENGSIHFYVIPSSWLEKGLEQDFLPIKPFAEKPFWQKGEFKGR